MTKEKLQEILRIEYGIKNEEEFMAVLENYAGINIGIFTLPFERSKNSEQEAQA